LHQNWSHTLVFLLSRNNPQFRHTQSEYYTNLLVLIYLQQEILHTPLTC
jgi:hypothetical protein